MAGSYPNTPGRRMAYDADGTVIGLIAQNFAEAVDEFTPTERADLNSEDESIAVHKGLNEPSRYLFAVFPELREVDGIFYAYDDRGLPTEVETSADTTNGIGGTWTQRIANLADFTIVAINYRTDIASMAVTGARGLRVAIAGSGSANSQRLKALHIYGEITAGETPDRLLWIDEATGVEFTGVIDYGDIPRGGSEDTEVRLRNNSAGLTASNIQYTTEALVGGSDVWYTFSLPGGATFQATQSVASLGPATSSGIITLRRITPGDFGLGLQAARAFVAVGSWS